MTKKEVSHIAMAEAILFMYGKEMHFKRLAELLHIKEKDAREIIFELRDIYNTRKDSGLNILVRDNEVQMVTDSAVASVIEDMTKKELEGALTPVAMEVLAIIAYRGPISKMDIEAVRGVNCSFTLRNLLRRGLIERVSVDASKRLQYYQITIELLRILGISSVEELPEFEELSTDKRIDAILYNDQNNLEQNKDLIDREDSDRT
ncbi:MAG: SMC-Scp complex subunit ScpB [Candidatus Moraniibacteriota bacterium]|nr:MAG: SMC-Scp complex subunit ScpB [Candidatus Moranbacteria bacterium]